MGRLQIVLSGSVLFTVLCWAAYVAVLLLGFLAVVGVVVGPLVWALVRSIQLRFRW